MKIAIMQPYLFPYIGYFQMMNAVDEFVLLDDVHYINKGWINRNRILVNKQDYIFTMPLKEASQNKLINEIEIMQDGKWQTKFLKTIQLSYKKAPFFDSCFSIMEKIILSEERILSKFILKSFFCINNYLDIPTLIKESSTIDKDVDLKGQGRILAICIKEKACEYINAIGGIELYSKEHFSKNNIELRFIKSNPLKYDQFKQDFVPWLSIIDVMMFNSKEAIRKMLLNYQCL
jgi:hypothetical protein